MKLVPAFLHYILVVFTIFLTGIAQGQIKIGDNPQEINTASVLELESNSRVLVITRVTTAQMDEIRPLQGAILYNTDTECLHYYNGTEWINICDAIAANITFSTAPIANTNETITITKTGDNFNFEATNIRGQNIVDFSINGVDLQENSITEDKLAPDSVGSEELQDNTVTDLEIDYSQVTISDFTNDSNYLTAANIISGDIGNDISFGSDNAAFFDDELLQDRITDANTIIAQNANAILTNTNAIATGVLTENITLTGTGVTGDPLRVNDAGISTVQIAPGSANQELRTDPTGTFVEWVDPATPVTPLTTDNISLETTGIDNSILQIKDQGVSTDKISPGAGDQLLSTNTLGIVTWAPKTSTDPGNVLAIGTDGGISYTNPIKAMGKVNGAGTLIKGVGVNTITRPGDGEYVVEFSTPMPDVNYVIQVSVLNGIGSTTTIKVTGQTLNGFTARTFDQGGFRTNTVWYFTILDF